MVNICVLVVVPAALVTDRGPVTAPTGTIAVRSVSFWGLNCAACVPMTTCVVPPKNWPEMVI
jgi:hypothetical protein